MFQFKTIGVASKQPVLFAMDDYYFPLKSNVCHYLSKPEIIEQPVLTRSDRVDAPDSLAAHFYGTVLYDEGKYRMWYLGMSLGLNPDMPAQELELHRKKTNGSLGGIMSGPICYAESDNGIDWVKPNLGQLLYKGNRNNNGIDLPDAFVHSPTVIKDEDDPDPKRRYKMVYTHIYNTEFNGGFQTARVATSPDGIHWTAGARGPIPEFVEHASFYKYNGLYVLNGQCLCGFRRSEGGAATGRQGTAWISTDFDNWMKESADSFWLADPHDPTQRGTYFAYDQVHLGTAPIVYDNVAVGLYGLWHHQQNPFKETSCDFGLLISNDGLTFREPVKGHVYISSQESHATPVPGKELKTNLCQSNGIINVGDETRIYHGRWRNAWVPEGVTDDYSGEVGLAILPRDRWGAIGLNPNQKEGSLLSIPITFPERDFSLAINADGAEGIRVEFTDEHFRTIPEFSGENSGIVSKDGLDQIVEWPTNQLLKLAGKTVRMRLKLEKKDQVDPRVYAVYLVK
ncbi:hypothetical protein [Paenibacillus ginsengarvi]|uniref:Glycosyl hydrolase family 32 N-terminal domain-containing protein n=1 Tax=Paenibacillus ginsengarvi TaxID=400777 RepID=A0A3B0B0I8_9BACL|nr:hypothetical protein [Paenibacillus ginsengarvi]RKN66052.1 hypothetical protein D7M11_31755 [Paenibacillus ginsengarvi]